MIPFSISWRLSGMVAMSYTGTTRKGSENRTGRLTELELLSDADPLLLGLTVVYLTGDMDLLAELELASDGTCRLKAEGKTRDVVLKKAAQLLEDDRVSDQPAKGLSEDMTRRLVNLAVGFPADERYVSLLLEQAGFVDRVDNGDELPPTQVRDFHVVVIGAGMSGICAAIDLKRAGIPFTVLEKTNAVGGTWHQNNYPGCGVDTPSYFYSYSFAPNPEWSRYFPKRPEIKEYFERCVDRFALREHIQLRTAVTAASFDESAQQWRVRVRSFEGTEKELRCSAIITAVGQLNIPAVPAIPGLDEFKGTVVHTAEWSEDHQASDQRVALFGAGASAMQVGPAIVESVKELKIFQRQPQWILPNPIYHADVPETEKLLHRRLPAYLRWKRLQMIWSYGDVVYPALKVDPEWKNLDVSLNEVSERYRQRMLRHIGEQVGDDPELLEKVTPNYPPYGKRVLLDNNWYKMLRRTNVDLITSGIESVGASSVSTSDGMHHEVDMIVLATGFKASKMLWPIEFRGRGGLSLRDVWKEDDPRAYLGITVPGFPNLFMMYGPNTNLAFGGSAIFNSECQSRYITACLRTLVSNGWATFECKQEVHDAYNDVVDSMHENMVWARRNVSNWFRNQGGRVTTNTPWSMAAYWDLTRSPNLNDYIVRGRNGREISSSISTASNVPNAHSVSR